MAKPDVTQPDAVERIREILLGQAFEELSEKAQELADQLPDSNAVERMLDDQREQKKRLATLEEKTAQLEAKVAELEQSLASMVEMRGILSRFRTQKNTQKK